MTYKTVTADVDIDVDLDEWNDEELAEELRYRGWFVSKVDVGVEKFQREDFEKHTKRKTARSTLQWLK